MTNELGFNSGKGQESSLHNRPDSGRNHSQSLIHGYLELFPLLVKLPGRESHCSLLCGTVFMKTWRYNSTSLYAFIISYFQVSMKVINGKISMNVVMKGNYIPSTCTFSDSHIWKGLRIFRKSKL